MSSRLAIPHASATTSRPARARPSYYVEAASLSARTNQSQSQVSCVPELVAAQAAVRPEAIALIAGAEKLSDVPNKVLNYGQLNDRANQIANHLISLGVDPNTSVGAEDIVALCLDRSVTGVVCALGILKANAAYLPLDPSYPAERLAFMLNDAKPRVLITTKETARQLPNGPWQVIAIDDDHDAAEIDRQSTNCPETIVTAERLAYVIYTSGSSGRPKGVEITHGGLMNLVSWHNESFEVTPKTRASLLAGVGFDAAVWETWPYLSAGASLHLPSDATRLAPERLRDWLVAQQITVSFLPTALAERVMNLEWPSQTRLGILLTGAETLRQFPSDDLPFRVVNNYGPTECTVVATSGDVPFETFADSLPTIGRPIANTEVHILDENLQPVPVHVAGEIYVGGAGVARGYLNQPELTAEKFVENPFSAPSGPKGRLYRTGDLARYLRSGEIAYLGRIDEQIKILGHRIEPNEIVSVLDRHPDVQASRVIASADSCREKHLVAYVVLKSESQPPASELRCFLENKLPQFMVPSVFVRLEAMPLTQNGKVDRAAMPAPTAENTLGDEVFTLPRTPVEERLAAMLTALLKLDQVSVHDNFFMLGGHSLLGTQLISQIRRAFGVELALRTLFEAPTIEQLALEIEQTIRARVAAMSEEEVAQLLA